MRRRSVKRPCVPVEAGRELFNININNISVREIQRWFKRCGHEKRFLRAQHSNMIQILMPRWQMIYHCSLILGMTQNPAG
jgi:hypothetical protein